MCRRQALSGGPCPTFILQEGNGICVDYYDTVLVASAWAWHCLCALWQWVFSSRHSLATVLTPGKQHNMSGIESRIGDGAGAGGRRGRSAAGEPQAFETSEEVPCKNPIEPWLNVALQVDVTPSFDSMGLKEDLIRGIYAYGAAVGIVMVVVDCFRL